VFRAELHRFAPIRAQNGHSFGYSREYDYLCQLHAGLFALGQSTDSPNHLNRAAVNQCNALNKRYSIDVPLKSKKTLIAKTRKGN
jgi:hypothetical protein